MLTFDGSLGAQRQWTAMTDDQRLVGSRLASLLTAGAKDAPQWPPPLDALLNSRNSAHPPTTSASQQLPFHPSSYAPRAAAWSGQQDSHDSRASLRESAPHHPLRLAPTDHAGASTASPHQAREMSAAIEALRQRLPWLQAHSGAPATDKPPPLSLQDLQHHERLLQLLQHATSLNTRDPKVPGGAVDVLMKLLNQPPPQSAAERGWSAANYSSKLRDVLAGRADISGQRQPLFAGDHLRAMQPRPDAAQLFGQRESDFVHSLKRKIIDLCDDEDGADGRRELHARLLRDQLREHLRGLGNDRPHQLASFLASPAQQQHAHLPPAVHPAAPRGDVHARAVSSALNFALAAAGRAPGGGGGAPWQQLPSELQRQLQDAIALAARAKAQDVADTAAPHAVAYALAQSIAQEAGAQDHAAPSRVDSRLDAATRASVTSLQGEQPQPSHDEAKAAAAASARLQAAAASPGRSAGAGGSAARGKEPAKKTRRLNGRAAPRDKKDMWCRHCGVLDTPAWRHVGDITVCNACGMRNTRDPNFVVKVEYPTRPCGRGKWPTKPRDKPSEPLAVAAAAKASQESSCESEIEAANTLLSIFAAAESS